MTEDIADQVKAFLTEFQILCEESGFFPEFKKVCEELLEIAILERINRSSVKAVRLEMPTLEALGSITEVLTNYSLAQEASDDLRRIDAANCLDDAHRELRSFNKALQILRHKRETAMRLSTVDRPFDSLNAFVLFVLGENYDQNKPKSFDTFKEVIIFVRAEYEGMLKLNNKIYFPESTMWGDSDRWGDRIKESLKTDIDFRDQFERFTNFQLPAWGLR